MRTLTRLTPVDECQPNPCSNGGTCSPVPSGYMCYCEDGYKGDTCEGKGCIPSILVVIIVGAKVIA